MTVGIRMLFKLLNQQQKIYFVRVSALIINIIMDIIKQIKGFKQSIFFDDLPFMMMMIIIGTYDKSYFDFT